MSRYLTFTKSNLKTSRKKTVNRQIKTGPVTLATVTIVLFCALGLLFLAQVFQSQTSNYKVIELNKKIDKLKEQNKDLEVKSAELRSFDKIQENAKKLNLVPSKDIVYINTSDISVALNK